MSRVGLMGGFGVLWFFFEADEVGRAVFFGREGETGSGNGAYDDFKMFDRVLSADENAELAKK